MSRFPTLQCGACLTIWRKPMRPLARALKKAGNSVGCAISLEKRATTSMSPTNVMSNERKKPEAKWTGKSAFETSRLHQINDPKFK